MNMLQKIELKTPDSLYIQVFLIYSIGSFADIKILSSLIKDKMVSMLLIWLKMLRMKKHAICMSLIWSISSSISFGRSKVIEGTLLNSQQKITRLFWVQSQWPLQAMIKTKSDRNKLKVSIFFLDSSNWNIDENHETMMTMRNDLFIVCLRKTSSGQFTKREITNW